MKAFIFKIQQNLILKKILYFAIVFLLFSYTFSIPAFSGRPVWYLISYFLMAALTGCTFLYTFFYSRFKFDKRFILPILFVFFAFVGTAIYSKAFVGKDGNTGWLTLVLMIITLIVFYYSYIAIGNKKRIMYILVFAFLLFGLYFAYIYRDQIIHLKLSSNRINVYFDNQNTIGFYFAIAYGLSLFVGLFYDKKIELLFLIPAFLFLFLGFFTGSRAFLISIVIGSIVTMYLKLRKHLIIFALAFACLIGLFFVLINIPQLAFLKDQFDRTIYTLFGIGNSKVDTSTIQRAVWPGYAFYLGGKNLLFGYGVNGFCIFSGIGTYAHNNYAELVCNFGIIGFILFNLCFITPLILSLRKDDKYTSLVFILFFMYAFRCLFGVVYYSKETYLILGLLFYLTKDYKISEIGMKKNHVSNNNFSEVKV